MIVEECKEALKSALVSINQIITKNQNCCLILSGGVDTSAILEANSQLGANGIQFSHYITVLLSETATDRPYAMNIARKFGIENQHIIIDIDYKELLGSLPFCIETLKSFDGMTLRNCIVIAKALDKAHELGCSVAITGDGADELLGGYSYTWATIEPEWSHKRKELSVAMNFQTPDMAKALHINTYSPYLIASFIDWAVARTSKPDCVDDVEIELSPSTARALHTAGKICLRRAFPESVSAWRRKDPIEVGSGSTYLTEYFNQYITDDEFQYEQSSAQEVDKVIIKDKEHLYYYRQFKCTFPSDIPLYTRFGSDPCKGCGYQLKSSSENFCYICGAWPAR